MCRVRRVTQTGSNTPNEIINTEEEAYKIKEYVRFDNKLFTFEDVIIKGKLEIEAEEIELKWNNVSLFEPFEVKSIKLNLLQNHIHCSFALDVC